ncbi:hypothetical protein GVAV_002017 [Gurleya vavrai]
MDKEGKRKKKDSQDKKDGDKSSTSIKHNADSSMSSHSSEENRRKEMIRQTPKNRFKQFLKTFLKNYSVFNYFISVNLAFILLIIAIFVRNQTIEITYLNKEKYNLPLSTVFSVVAICLFFYIIFSMFVKYVLSYIQSRKQNFNIYLYCAIHSTEHFSIIFVVLTVLMISLLKKLNFNFGQELGIEMTFNDIMLVFIVGDSLLWIITFFTAMVSTTFNKETYVERMLSVLRNEYFFKLMKSINSKIVIGDHNRKDVWMYGFPWVKDPENMQKYQTNEYKELIEIFFKHKSEKLMIPKHRNYIFDTFRKIPENVLYSDSEIEMNKTERRKIDSKVNKIFKTLQDEIEMIGDFKIYFDPDAFKDFNSLYGFSENTQFNKNLIFLLLQKNFYEIKHIQQSLKQILQALTRVQNFMYVIVFVLMIAYVFSRNPKNTSTATSILSGFFGTGIIFQSSVTSAIDSIIFLFCIHPFDIGDRCFISIDDVNENFVVTEMNVFSTVFIRFDGTMAYIPNSVLSGKAITNVRRSGMMAESHKLQISAETPKGKLIELEKQITLFVKSQPEYFTGFCMLNIENIENCNKMHLKVFVQHKFNWHDYTEYLKAKKSLLTNINRIMIEQDISYYLPDQKIIFKSSRLNMKEKFLNEKL